MACVRVHVRYRISSYAGEDEDSNVIDLELHIQSRYKK
jgi:hypothetical protein